MQIFRAAEIVSVEGPEVLLKMPKDARPSPDGFSNLRVLATPNHKKVHTYSCFGFNPLATRLYDKVSV